MKCLIIVTLVLLLKQSDCKPNIQKDDVKEKRDSEDRMGNKENGDNQPADATQDEISRFVEHVMQCRHVPGLSLSIIKDGQPHMASGHGVRDFRTNTPITNQTRFCIGSLSKAFTSNLLAILLKETGYTWDSRIVDIMGVNFTFEDSMKTEYATVKDILSHRMGYPSYPGVWMMGLDLSHSRQEYCSRFNHLSGFHGFRQRFAYSNWMFMLASCLAEKLGGKSFEELMEERLFVPLRMSRTMLLENATADWSQMALPHVWDNDTGYIEIDRNLIYTVSPAEGSGGVVSTAVDMQKWMMMQLSEGRGEEEIIDRDFWQETVYRQFFVPGSSQYALPVYPFHDDTPNYGLAWYIGSYQGMRLFRHSGATPGYNSLLTLYPDTKLGVFTVINGPEYSASMALEVIHHYISDIMMNRQPWLNDSLACTYPELLQAAESGGAEELAKTLKANPMETVKTRDVNKPMAEEYELYAGRYGHPLLANITITYNVTLDSLEVQHGSTGCGRLSRFLGEIFVIQLYHPWDHIHISGPLKGIEFPIRFAAPNATGVFHEIVATSIEPNVPPVFVRDLWWDQM